MTLPRLLCSALVKKWGLAPPKPPETLKSSRRGWCLSPFLHKLSAFLVGVCAVPLGFIVPAPAAEYVEKKGNAELRLEAERVDKGQVEMRLSDQLTLTFTVEGAAGLQVQPVQTPATSADWETSAKFKPQRTVLAGGRLRWQQKVAVSPAKAGDLTLALEPLRFREASSAAAWEQVAWKPIHVRVTTEVLNPDLAELRDVTPPEQLPPGPVWRVPVYLAALPLALAGALLGIVYLRRRARRQVAPPPDVWALGELERIERLPLSEQAGVERLHTLLSDVVRRYLELRFQLPAPEQTTAEFLAAVQSSSLPEEQQAMVRDLLERCDLVKFARAQPSVEECQALAAAARRFVHESAALPPTESRPITDQNQETIMA
jgi:hypothetical protein